ncbi:MAG: V-type ATP synthase subunit F [Firmicutes bacterium ADurb.Bin193]|nr:MAG: V-type ATP synthase subunit F [Firmicutes bacterium ADurb.Bin193]
MKMYLISDNIDTQIGMRLAGIDGVVVHEREEFIEALTDAVSDKDIGIILITVKLSQLAPELVSDIKLNYKIPLIVEIPDRHGMGKTDDFITGYVRDAIGLKI